jgi:1-acyl-sn-glycerol-3-phosphate acyltransferase
VADKKNGEIYSVKQKLTEAGHEVKTTKGDNPAEFEGASVIHFFNNPTKNLIKAAEKAGVPCTASFSVGLKRKFCKRIRHIHCASQGIADMLAKYRYRAKKYIVTERCESIARFEQMLKDAVSDFDTKKLIDTDKELTKQRIVKRMLNNTKVKRQYVLGFLKKLLIYGLFLPVFFITSRVFLGLKIKNKKTLRQLKKQGAIMICNHIHIFDFSFCDFAAFPRKITFTTLQKNFSKKGLGWFFKIFGVVPTPANFAETKVFFYSLGEVLRKGKLVHFYPEGDLKGYDKGLRTFQKGAFHLAVTSQAPIIPMRVVYRKPRGMFRLIKRKPCMTIKVGEPLYPDYSLPYYQAIDSLKLCAEEAMEQLGENIGKDAVALPASAPSII